MANMKVPVNPFEVDVNFNVEEYAIGGKLLSVTVEIPHSEYLQHENDLGWKNQMRKMLSNKLSEAILNSNFVEITTHQDLLNMNQKIHARCYLAPNEQVKIIRSLKNNVPTRN